MCLDDCMHNTDLKTTKGSVNILQLGHVHTGIIQLSAKDGFATRKGGKLATQIYSF